MVIVMAFGTGASVVSAGAGREGWTVSVRMAGAGVARGVRECVRRRTKDSPDPGVARSGLIVCSPREESVPRLTRKGSMCFGDRWRPTGGFVLATGDSPESFRGERSSMHLDRTSEGVPACPALRRCLLWLPGSAQGRSFPALGRLALAATCRVLVDVRPP